MKKTIYYKAKYKRFIEQRKNRQINGVVEIHHILPRCLGGTDNLDNLISLTPREHYIAHVFLHKIYPNNAKITKALSAMKIGNGTSKYNRQLNSKEYDYIKKAVSKKIPPKNVLIKLYKRDLLSCVKIGKKYNVSAPTVERWLNHFSIEPNEIKNYRGKPSPKKEELQMMIAEYNYQVKDIAKHYNISKSMAYKWFKANDIKFTQTIGIEKPVPAKEELLYLYEDKKYNVIMLMKHYNVSRTLLQKWFKLYNITAQKRKKSHRNIF